MGSPDLPIEYHSEARGVPGTLEAEAQRSLLGLSEGHKDMTGATVTISRPEHGETPHLYQARVIVYMRPEHVTASEKHEDPEIALKGALAAVERQIRERRVKLKESWKRPDL
jgi:ribosome-associated translation inhibitor RaiA